MTLPGRPPSGDDGRVSVFFAIAFLAAIAMIGLCYDGGAKLRATQRADNIAAEAARAAGQAINGGQAVEGHAVVVDRQLAERAARSYLSAAGVRGSVRFADDRKLTVTVEIRQNTVMLSLIGTSQFTVTGSATATLVTG